MFYMHYTCTLDMQIFSEFYYKPFQIQKRIYFLPYIKAAPYVIKILLYAGQFYKIPALCVHMNKILLAYVSL